MALPGPTTMTSKTARDQLRIIAARYGETGASPYLLPLSVDGLIIVASVSLVEISGRLRSAQPNERTPTAKPAPPPEMPPVAPTMDMAPQLDVPVDAAPDRPQPAAPASVDLPRSRSLTDGTPADPVVSPAETAAQSAELIDAPAGPVTPPVDQAAPPTEPMISLVESQLTSGAGDAIPPAQQPQPHDPTEDETAAQLGLVVPAEPAAGPHESADTDHEVPAAPRDAIAYWQNRLPGISVEDLAERIGKSPRQIRRYLRTPASNVPQQVNGRRNDTLVDTVHSASP